MPRIVVDLGTSVAEPRDFSTLCARKQTLKMAVWRIVLRLSAAPHDGGEVQAIDATGYERHSTSRQYANRVDYTFEP